MDKFRWYIFLLLEGNLIHIILIELKKSTLRYFRGREYLIKGLFIRDYTQRNKAKHPFSFISSPSEPKIKLKN